MVKNMEEIILEKIAKSMNKNSGKRNGIHVSSISYDCMRKAYYSIKYGNRFNLNTLMTFWIGQQVHKTPILAENEIPLEWERIRGSCDDYENGILLEKKTCTVIPSKPREQHVKQAEYYSVMLEEQGKPVKKIYILYIDINNKKIKVFEAKRRDSKTIKKEMLEKRDAIEKAMREGKPPERNISWLCSYCNHSNICFRSRD